MYDPFRDQLPDIDPDETAEWVEALDQVIDASPARARLLLSRILRHVPRSFRTQAGGPGNDSYGSPSL